MFAITRFSQMDPRWKDKQLGNDPSLTIGSHGCLLTGLAMVTAGFGFDVTPVTLNELLIGLGPNVGFQGGLVIPASLPRVVPGMIYRRYVSARSTPAPVAEIRASLAASLPVIVEVDYAPAPGLQTHWLVLYDLKGDDFCAQDPFPYPPETSDVLLSQSRFAFAGSLENIITAAIWLEGPRPAVTKPPGAVSVFTTVDQLALRTQPFIDPSNLIKRYPQGTELYSLKPVDVTLQKVGIVNQWLQVQDGSGAQGYVAAWYLDARQPAPPQTGAVLRVFASVDQLALRSSPVIGPDNLVKRLPFGSELVILDDVPAAQAKIGVLNQWLKVREPGGQTGYVAAWYVSVQAQPALGPGTPPGGSAASDLRVRPHTAGLALRSLPRIAPETLMLRLDLGSVLIVLEPRAEALPKVGMPGQWLLVRDPAGHTGYVAAWYVNLVDQ